MAAIKPSEISAEAWLEKMPMIRRLYLDEGYSLERVKSELEGVGFKASKQQYKRKFEQWAFKKNFKSSQVKAINKSLKRKRLDPDNALVTYGRVTMESKRLKRALARNCLPSLLPSKGLSPRTPEGVIIQSKVPESGMFQNLNIPGLTLLEHFRSLNTNIEDQIRTHAPETTTNISLANALWDQRPMGRDLLTYFPKQNHAHILQDVQGALTARTASLDVIMVGYVLYLCGNRLMSEYKLETFTTFILQHSRATLYDLLESVKSPHIRCFEEYLLLYAAREDRYDIAEILKRRGVNLSLPRQPFPPARTALQEAIVHKSESFCRKLMLDGVDVDVVPSPQEWMGSSSEFDSPPIRLALISMPSIVEAMLTLTKRINVVREAINLVVTEDFDCTTVLQDAIISNDLAQVKALLHHGADPNGPSPDHLAAVEDEVEADDGENENDFDCSFLEDDFYLDSDSFPESRFRRIIYRIRTPLQMAIQKNNMEVCEALLSAGANPNICRCHYTRNARGSFDDYVRPLEVYFLHPYQVGSVLFSAMQTAVWSDNISVVRMLLVRGARVVCCHGVSPLKIALHRQCSAIVELLLQHGAILNSTLETQLATAIMALMAGKPGFPDSISTLLSPHFGRTPELFQWYVDRAAELISENREATIAMLPAILGFNISLDVQGAITGLQAAAEADSIELVEVLLANGADLNARPAHCGGQTALSGAIKWNNNDMLQFLVRKGACITFNGWLGGDIDSIPIVAAASSGSTWAVQTLLSYGLDLSTTVHFDRNLDQLALKTSTWMRMEDRRQIVNLHELALIEAVASCRSDDNVIDLLLRVNYPLSEYAVMRALTVIRPSVTAALPLAQRLWDMLPGKSCAKQHVVGSCKSFIQHQMEHLLRRATEWNNYSMCRFLLGIVISPTDYRSLVDGQVVAEGRALQAACMKGNMPIVQLLLEHGADVNVQTLGKGGRTALQAAAEKGNIEIVELLLRHDADINAPPAAACGVTALQAAVIGGHMCIAQILIEAGADIGAAPAPKDGVTAINGAAQHGRLDMVKLLLDFYKLRDGESISSVCDEAAGYARREYHWEVVKLLENYQRAPCSSP